MIHEDVKPSKSDAHIGGNFTTQLKFKEGEKPFTDYLKLNVEEYSNNLLLVEAVIRHDPKTYECHLTPVGFFGKTIQPIVTGIVKDDDEHFLKVERAEFKCNDKFIEKICNDKIKVSGFMTLNVLQEKQESIMHADSEMKVQIGLPKFFPLGKQVF